MYWVGHFNVFMTKLLLLATKKKKKSQMTEKKSFGKAIKLCVRTEVIIESCKYVFQINIHDLNKGLLECCWLECDSCKL